jgi:hypothetical protein
MNRDWIVVPMILLAEALLIAIFFIRSEINGRVTLKKEEWRCIKSIMVDDRNVDKVECILYSKEEKDNDSE